MKRKIGQFPYFPGPWAPCALVGLDPKRHATNGWSHMLTVAARIAPHPGHVAFAGLNIRTWPNFCGGFTYGNVNVGVSVIGSTENEKLRKLAELPDSEELAGQDFSPGRLGRTSSVMLASLFHALWTFAFHQFGARWMTCADTTHGQTLISATAAAKYFSPHTLVDVHGHATRITYRRSAKFTNFNSDNQCATLTTLNHHARLPADSPPLIEQQQLWSPASWRGAEIMTFPQVMSHPYFPQ